MKLQRLLCINNKPIPGADNGAKQLAAIKEGKDYEGYQADAINKSGIISLAWCIPSISETDGYCLERFIPLPDTPAEVIEETELVTA